MSVTADQVTIERAGQALIEATTAPAKVITMIHEAMSEGRVVAES